MRPEGPVLRRGEYLVEPVPLGMARQLVAAHHYTGGSSTAAVYRHGIFRPEQPLDCLGVALWMPAPPGAARSVADDWRGVLSLSRLVIEPGMPTNAASFLLGQSIRLIRREGRFHTLVTYADEGQGHTGAIYRATNWQYAGTVLGHPTWVDGHGRHVSHYADGVTRTAERMGELGYRLAGQTRKRKFILQLEGAR